MLAVTLTHRRVPVGRLEDVVRHVDAGGEQGRDGQVADPDVRRLAGRRVGRVDGVVVDLGPDVHPAPDVDVGVVVLAAVVLGDVVPDDVVRLDGVVPPLEDLEPAAVVVGGVVVLHDRVARVGVEVEPVAVVGPRRLVVVAGVVLERDAVRLVGPDADGPVPADGPVVVGDVPLDGRPVQALEHDAAAGHLADAVAVVVVDRVAADVDGRVGVVLDRVRLDAGHHVVVDGVVRDADVGQPGRPAVAAEHDAGTGRTR